MNRFSLTCGFVIGLQLIAVVSAQTPNEQLKAIEIPLDQIWGYRLPGARDIYELEPKRDTRNLSMKEYIAGSLVNTIVMALHRVPPEGDFAGPAFVVVGTGREALKRAYDVIAEGNPPETELPQDTDLSLVFYSYTTGWHLRIRTIERTPNLVTVNYQFVAQPIGHNGATRFVIVPIGKFSKGTVRVSVEEEMPVDFNGRRVTLKKDSARFVCSSFSFEVQ